VFTPERVAAFKHRETKIDFVADLLPLLLLEMGYVYYTALLGEAFGERFLACTSEAERRRLIEAHVPADDRFCWEDLQNPFRCLESAAAAGQPLFASMAAYTDFVLAYMEADIVEAEKGNLTSPLKTALDAVLRDLRDTLRAAVDRGGLTAASHRYLDRDFNRINNRIAVGPPVSSTRELVILARAGIVSFSGPAPRLSMDEENGVFWVESDAVPGSRRAVQHVLNGRIHSVDNKNDTSALIQNLYRRRMIRNFVNCDETGTYELGGLDIDDDFHLIDAHGRSNPHLCALGIPIEGKYWFNAADARPDVDSNAIGQLSRWAANAVDRLRTRETAGRQALKTTG
jgi:hypothetical protein